MSRTLVFGDIHGGLKALEQLLDKVDLVSTDKLIFLGDYVDSWSESAKVIDFLIKLEKSNDCIFIKGNHDVWCEDWLQTEIQNKTWLQHGGKSTVESYQNYCQIQKSEHLEFFKKMKFYEIDNQNRLFIHAGFTSMHGPEKEFYKSNFSWDRTLWEM